MKDPVSRNIQFNSSGLGCFLTLILIAALLTSVGLGWIVNAVVVLVLAIPVAIALGFIGLRWWLKRNVIEEACPVCQQPLTGLNNSLIRCTSCGEVIQVENQTFQRQAPEGTVDVVTVEAVDIQMEAADMTIIDVPAIEPGVDSED